MTKKLRNFLLIGSTLGIITATAISIPLVMTQNTTITANNVVNNTTDDATNSGTTSQVSSSNSKLITSALAQKENSSSSNLSNMNGYDKVSRITKEFTSGFSKYKVFKYNYSFDGINYDTISNSAYETQKLYQSPDYYNQRDVMPILSTSYNYSYPNERSQNDVEWDVYHGWNRVDVGYYEQTTYSNSYMQRTYTASKVLESTLTAETISKLTTMKALTIDFTDSHLASLSSSEAITEANYVISKLVGEGYNFIIINGASQTELEGIKIPSGVKKLTIKDFDGQLESLRGISIANSVEELEFYSTSATKVDPLVLTSNTHFIYDHISDDNVTRGKLTFSPFTMIDLTSHKNLTTSELQQAINIVYGERQYERSFQGNFSAGYIYQLDLSGTGITSLNNVYVPSQSDGRFNIAYVKWTSGASGGSVTITIGGTQLNPGNDGSVNEWYDASGDAEKVTKLVFKTETGKTITSEAVITEVNGLLKKYPNVIVINISGISLATGEDIATLAQSLYDNLAATYTANGLEIPSSLKVIYGSGLEITSSSSTN